MTHIDLSIIIVSFNTKGLLRECLNSVGKSLKGSGIACEVIVVENASTDGTREMLKKEFSEIKTLYNDTNEGYGKANNIGLSKARGEYILLLNSDTVVVGDAINRLYGFTKRHQKAFVGAKLYNVNGTPQTSCGPFFTLPVVFASLFLKGDKWGLTRWSPNRPCRVDWVSGACFMAARRIFSDDLLFDESIFMYMEEVELMYRASIKGYQTYFFSNARVIHMGAASSGERRQPVLNIYRGLLYFYKTYYSKRSGVILRVMLKAKARIAQLFGLIIGNEKIKETYAEAYRLVP